MSMKTDFIRFSATDQVELQGWLTNESGDTAVLHIHGMSGNGYENYFLDSLRQMYIKQSLSFFTIDTRGRGIISDFRQGNGWKHGGSCFEIFEESIQDIQGAINYLKSLHKTRIILQGHSLGCTKVVHYITHNNVSDIYAAILLAPTDMVGWAKTDPNHTRHLAKAKALLSEGKGEELVAAQCWLDKTHISSQTYPAICEEGSSADIYGEREGGALLGRVSMPMLIPYGDKDIGIVQIDGTMENWLQRVNKIKNAHTQIAVIPGAEHGFRGYEAELSNVVEAFVQKITK